MSDQNGISIRDCIRDYRNKKQSTYTPIPQLGINSELNKLQLESQTYFTIGGAARADDNTLAITAKQHFLTTNADHTEFLKQCTELVKKNQCN